MQKFVAILKDKKKGELPEALLLKHVEHLRTLNYQSKLLLCGPFKDNDKAIQILNCETINEAKRLVEADPFIKEGYYDSYEINELIEANEENNWLIDIPQTQDNVKEKS